MDRYYASEKGLVIKADGKCPEDPSEAANQYSYASDDERQPSPASKEDEHFAPRMLQHKTVLESQCQPVENNGEKTRVASTYIIPSARGDVDFLEAAATNTFPKLDGENQPESISELIDQGQTVFTTTKELDENRLHDSGECGYNPAPDAQESSDKTLVTSGLTYLASETESEPNCKRSAPGTLLNDDLVPEHDEVVGEAGERSDLSKDEVRDTIQQPDATDLSSGSELRYKGVVAAWESEAHRHRSTPAQLQNEGLVAEPEDVIDTNLEADPSKFDLTEEVQHPDKFVNVSAEVQKVEHTDDVREGVHVVQTASDENSRDYEQAVVDRREVQEAREIVQKPPLENIDDLNMETEVVVEPTATPQGPIRYCPLEVHTSGEVTVVKDPVAENIDESSYEVESVSRGSTNRMKAVSEEIEKNEDTETVQPSESLAASESFEAGSNAEQLVILEVKRSKAADPLAADKPDLEKCHVPVLQTDAVTGESTTEIVDGDSICEAADQFTPRKSVELAEEPGVGLYATAGTEVVADGKTLQLLEVPEESEVDRPSCEAADIKLTENAEEPEIEEYSSTAAQSHTHDRTEGGELPEPEISKVGDVDQEKVDESYEAEATDPPAVELVQEAAVESAIHEAADSAMPTKAATVLGEKSEIGECFSRGMESQFDDKNAAMQELPELEKSEAVEYTPSLQSLDQKKDRSDDAQATDPPAVNNVHETAIANASFGAASASGAMVSKELELEADEELDCDPTAMKSHVDDLTKEVEFPKSESFAVNGDVGCETVPMHGEVDDPKGDASFPMLMTDERVGHEFDEIATPRPQSGQGAKAEEHILHTEATVMCDILHDAAAAPVINLTTEGTSEKIENVAQQAPPQVQYKVEGVGDDVKSVCAGGAATTYHTQVAESKSVVVVELPAISKPDNEAEHQRVGKPAASAPAQQAIPPKSSLLGILMDKVTGKHK